MIRPFTSFIKTNKLFQSEDNILLAVSGGMDSVAMSELFHRARFSFGIAHCNFSLRGAESDEDAAFVKTLAAVYGVPFFTISFNTPSYAVDHGISIQMAARELRYEWFEKIRQENRFDYIATAHHLDDQAETFIINLIRGTGIFGLHGILPAYGKLVRPMLFTSREEIVSFVKSEDLVYREDSSNASDKYTRNKIRHQLLPILQDINPEFTAGLTGTIGRIRGFEEIGQVVISEMRSNIFRTDGVQTTIDIPGLRKLHPLHAFAWELLSPFGFSQGQVADIIRSLDRESGKTFYTKEYRLIRDREKLIITSGRADGRTGGQADGRTGGQADGRTSGRVFVIEKSAKMISVPVALTLTLKKNTPRFQVQVGSEVANLDVDKLEFPLTLRKWRNGDSFYPFGLQQKQKLSDFFINSRVSLAGKEDTWLLCSGDKIVWIVGQRIDNRFRITGKTKHVLQIRFTK